RRLAPARSARAAIPPRRPRCTLTVISSPRRTCHGCLSGEVPPGGGAAALTVTDPSKVSSRGASVLPNGRSGGGGRLERSSGEREEVPPSCGFSYHLLVAREAVQHDALGSFLGQDPEGVVPCVSYMDNERLARLARQRDVGAESTLLVVG